MSPQLHLGDGAAYHHIRFSVTLPPSLRTDASHYRNRESPVRRQTAERHLEDCGICRKRWWASPRSLRTRCCLSRTSMYCRRSSRINSLMERSSSSITCRTCSAIFGGMEMVITSWGRGHSLFASVRMIMSYLYRERTILMLSRDCPAASHHLLPTGSRSTLRLRNSRTLRLRSYPHVEVNCL